MSSRDWFDGAIDLTGEPLMPPPPVNGTSHHPPPAAPSRDLTAELDSVPWFAAYDRPSVEAYLAALDDEKVRLEADIADAERRTAIAQQALAARAAELEAGLGAVVLAARAELERIEREQDVAVAAIRAEAEAEAERIRAAARLEAGTVRDASAALASLATDRPAPPERPSFTAPSSIPLTRPPDTNGGRPDAG